MGQHIAPEPAQSGSETASAIPKQGPQGAPSCSSCAPQQHQQPEGAPRGFKKVPRWSPSPRMVPRDLLSSPSPFTCPSPLC
eukprot:3355009-Pyramimonas_sp.AAC.1